MIERETMDAERETMQVDCLFVGGGPASLAAAIKLADLVRAHEERRKAGQPALRDLSETTLLLIEKAERLGGHSLSGAVLDMSALDQLLPDAAAQGAPLGHPVAEDEFRFLTGSGSLRIPVTPPGMSHHGGRVISLNRLVAWLGGQAEARGVEVLPGFAGRDVLWEDDRVAGVRTGDKGVGRDGKPRGNFEPGVDLRARITVFGEGPRGSLTRQVTEKLRLDADCDPPIFSLGIKEIWRVPRGRTRPGAVTHTLGFPLPSHVFGGSFLYHLDEEHLAIGLVMSLDYGDPRFDPHCEFQRLKTHPFVRGLIEGGELVRYGAKVIPEGGWYALPRPHFAGGMLVGESAGFNNVQRLKGIHLAIHSGIAAAETAYQALASGDSGAAALASYGRRLAEGPVHAELRRSRNFRPAFAHGLWSGIANLALLTLTGGNFPGKAHRFRPDHLAYRKLREVGAMRDGDPAAFDGRYTFNKDNDVFYSGTRHEEDQPAHLLVADTEICRTRCREEFGNPCQRFCPANVYEMVDDEDRGGKRLLLHADNCVHCKTCDIMDPYAIITWVTPEGGGGPDYVDM